jgi:hypothetical protein
VAEFISENPQDSKINDTIFLSLRSGFRKIFSGIYARKTKGFSGEMTPYFWACRAWPEISEAEFMLGKPQVLPG